MNTAILKFENTTFDIVDRDSQPWLRAYQIGSALGYSRPDVSIPQIFDRNKDEFTDQMTALVELDTAGGKQQVRIFSLRGCHLLAMLARTEKAKAFRRWVLDILDNLAQAKSDGADLYRLLRDVIETQKQSLSIIQQFAPKPRATNSRPAVNDDIPMILNLKSEGISQAEIARTLGLSCAMVSMIVRGYYKINDDGSVSVVYPQA